MTMAQIVAALLAVAVLIGWARIILWQRAAPDAARARRWRIAALLALQPVCATLLFFCLFPPALSIPTDSLLIATADAPRSGAHRIALPEAPQTAEAEAVPDLGTALRRHPGTRAIRVVGTGLNPRDIDAARGLSVSFDPPPLRPAIIALDPPLRTAPGASFTVGGQLAALPGGTVELIDPAGRITDRQTSASDGRFTLTGTARAAGPVLFRLRIRNARGQQVELADVPILVADSPAPRLLIMAGAPGPEVKYLRRWATDAGFAVTTMTSAGGGVALGDAPVAINAASLRRYDVAIIDDRSLSGQRGALIGAVRDGLGLLLRASGPIDAATRAQWQALGFSLTGGNAPAPIALPASGDAPIARTRQGIASADAPADPDIAADILPDISRLGPTAGGSDTVPLLRDAAGTPLAAWRAMGSGRIALFTGLDSYALILTGRRTLYGDWWSQMLSTIARPAPGGGPAIPQPAWVGERIALCGLTGTPRVTQPDGAVVSLAPDPAARNCAAFWPTTPGWHFVRGSGGNAAPVYIQPSGALPGVRAARNVQATLLLRGIPPNTGMAVAQRPGSPWPWFFGWLVGSALSWWLERAKIGRRTA